MCARVEQEGTVLGSARWLSLKSVQVIMVVLGEVEDGWGNMPSKRNPIREQVRTRYGTRT